MKKQLNVGKYTNPMDGMGSEVFFTYTRIYSEKEFPSKPPANLYGWPWKKTEVPTP